VPLSHIRNRGRHTRAARERPVPRARRAHTEGLPVTRWVKTLIIACIVVFFLQQTVPGLTDALLLVPAYALQRPWTLVTYMFLHAGFMHIFFNLLVLYFFGPRVEQRMGSERFIALYLISGVAGALLSFMTPHAGVLGASGAIYGVELAFAYFWPRDQIYIWGVLPIEARWLVVITVAMQLFFIRQGGGGVAYFAHLGGFAGAFVYLKWLERNRGARKFKAATAPRVVDPRLENWRRVDPARVHEVNRDELNRILDKVSAQGLPSLTADERRFLASFVPPDDRVPPPT
jgi:membrane associated rhomboid family serine protease